MKKNRMLRYIKSGLLGVCLISPSLMVQAETWKFALEEVKGDIQDIYAQEFKKRIEAKTKGEVEVDIYYYGTLGTSADVTELAADSAIQFANATPGHLGSFIPEVQLFSIPFILSDNPEVNKKLLTGSKAIFSDLAEDFDNRGIQLMTMYPEGSQVWTTNKLIKTPEDFDNFKMRVMVSPLLVESYKDFGANPAPLPFGEVYSGLQLKLIDGQENPLSSIYAMKFHEVTDYMIWAEHQQYTTTVITGNDWFDSLSEERRQMITETFKEVSDWVIDQTPALEAEFLAKIKLDAPDNHYIHLSEQERQAFKTASLKTREKYIDMTGDRGRQILDRFLAEREELEQQLGDTPSMANQ
ncbi:TRAP transporter substrate-binding protein DctP [Amphritea sp.]|uniref:TRAP transporter substrate-binding protein n=1 Tax=Amphritea sp. TaxID=1872502 RepID=UPI003D0F3C6B